ncbi:hypothetical protein ACTGUJ_11670, partial [Streptococcus suis]
ELSVCFSLSVTNLSHSKFYLISLSQSNFQFLRQTRTYFGNLATKKSFEKVLTRPSEDDRINELSLEGLVNRGTKKSFKKVLTKFTRNDKLR